MRHVNQEPLVGATPTIIYHRKLLEIAIIAVILGGVFLVFWQSVAGGPEPATWDENYCRKLLSRYEPDILSVALAEEETEEGSRLAAVFSGKSVEMKGVGERVDTCSITIVADQPISDGFGDSYDCTIAYVRYKTENRTDWLMIGKQIELMPGIMGGIPRFTATIVYYNPSSALALFEAEKTKLAAHSCEM